MSALDNIPQNQNFLTNHGYKFYIKKAPHLNFFIQDVIFPEISSDPTEHPTPFSRIPYPGDHIDFGTLSISFKLDEDLKTYLEMFDWFYSLYFPTKYEEYLFKSNRIKSDLSGLTSDVTLMILNSSNNPKFGVNFIDAFPTNLSGFRLSTTDSTTQFLEANITFKYTYFYIENL